MDKIWVKHYPKGIPAEIDVNEYASVREIFEESVGKYGPRSAFTCMGKTITFASSTRCPPRSAPGCRGVGCKKGERVAIMMPNILQYPIAVTGSCARG